MIWRLQLERSESEIPQVNSPTVRSADQTQRCDARWPASNAPVPGNSPARHPTAGDEKAWTQTARHDRFKLTARIAVAISYHYFISDKDMPLAAARQMKVRVVA